MAGLKRGTAPKTPSNLKTGVHLPQTATPPRMATGGAMPPQGRTGVGKMPPGGSAPGMPGRC